MKKLVLLLTAVCVAVGCMAQVRKTDEFTTPSGKTVRITCIKHASMLIEFDGKNIYVDPVSDLPPKTDYTPMPTAHYILVTHEHQDHFDRHALAQLRAMEAVVYAPQSVARLFHHARLVRNGDHVNAAKGIELDAVPAYNITEGRENLHPKGRDNGYILTLDGFRIYIAGDTEDIPEMEEIENIDVAFLPCNQPYTMTVAQMVRAAKIIKPKVLFPYHYNDTPVRQGQLMLTGTGIDVRIRDYQ